MNFLEKIFLPTEVKRIRKETTEKVDSLLKVMQEEDEKSKLQRSGDTVIENLLEGFHGKH